MVKSDPKDWEIWQGIHNKWTRLVDAELDRRNSRATVVYLQLLNEIRDDDDLLTHSPATPGLSTSTLSQVEAFERGYLGFRPK